MLLSHQESESKEARVIKSHHNVGGLPDDMEMELVEPLRDLFKDEVRKMGLELGLPAEMINRHPFPGSRPWGKDPGRNYYRQSKNSSRS